MLLKPFCLLLLIGLSVGFPATEEGPVVETTTLDTITENEDLNVDVEEKTKEEEKEEEVMVKEGEKQKEGKEEEVPPEGAQQLTCTFTDVPTEQEVTITYVANGEDEFDVVDIVPAEFEDALGKLSTCLTLKTDEQEAEEPGLESKNAKLKNKKKQQNMKMKRNNNNNRKGYTERLKNQRRRNNLINQRLIREGRPTFLLQQIKRKLSVPLTSISISDAQAILQNAKRFIDIKRQRLVDRKFIVNNKWV